MNEHHVPFSTLRIWSWTHCRAVGQASPRGIGRASRFTFHDCAGLASVKVRSKRFDITVR